MVALEVGQLRHMPFGTFSDPVTGRTHIREVDVTTESYKVARKYMIRLEKSDLEDASRLAAIAAAAKMDPAAFRARYGHIVETLPSLAPAGS